MGFFSNLFKKSGFFSSELTDKSMMPLTEVMSAHANWKSRVTRFAEGTLGYSLDPEILAQANDTELGRWILQADLLDMSDEKRKLIAELHVANEAMHQVASDIARQVLAGKRDELTPLNARFAVAAKRVMTALMAFGQSESQ